MKKNFEESDVAAGQQLPLLKAKAQAADRAAKTAKEKARLEKGKYKASRKAFKQAKKAAKQAAKRAKRAETELAACLTWVSTTAPAPIPSPQTVAKLNSARKKTGHGKTRGTEVGRDDPFSTAQSEKPNRPASSERDPNIELSGLRHNSTPKPKS